MAEEETHGSRAPAMGVAGAVLAIASIWWFALRPRWRRPPSGGEAGSED